MENNFKERRIWYFKCAKCGKSHRSSHKKRNAANQLCMKCRKYEAPENQPRLFVANGSDEVIQFGKRKVTIGDFQKTDTGAIWYQIKSIE